METQQSQYTRNALTCCELACCCGSQQAAWICSVCNWNWTSILSSQMNWAPLIQHNYCQITIQHWDRNKHNVVCNSNGLGYAQHNTKAPKTLLARVEWYVVASPFSSIVIQMNRTSAPMLPCVVDRTEVQCCYSSDHKLTNWQCSCVRVILFSICVNVGEPTKTWYINYFGWLYLWKVHKVSQKHPTSLGTQIAKLEAAISNWLHRHQLRRCGVPGFIKRWTSCCFLAFQHWSWNAQNANGEHGSVQFSPSWALIFCGNPTNPLTWFICGSLALHGFTDIILGIGRRMWIVTNLNTVVLHSEPTIALKVGTDI